MSDNGIITVITVRSVFVTQEKINRINELAKKSRTQKLTPAELDEQKKLRDEYRALFRANLTGQLNNMTIVEPDGTKTRVADRKKDS